MKHAVEQNTVAKSPSKKGSFFGKKETSPFFAPARVQPKLTIGPVDDPYEREADAVADKVMRMSDMETVQTKASSINIQRKCAGCEGKEKVQMKAADTFIQRSPGDETPPVNLNVPKDWEERPPRPPYLKIQVTMPPIRAGSTADMVNYGEANLELINRGNITPADYTVPYAAFWNNNYQLSARWGLGTMARNLFEKGDAVLKPVRGVLNKIPLAGGFISSKVKLNKPELKDGDWDRYVADKTSLTALGGAVDRDNPAYNAGSGFTFTVNVVDIHFDENNFVKRLFRKPANNNSSHTSFDINRKCAHCEQEEKVQMKVEAAASDAMAAPSVVHDVINSGGQPLDASTRDFMETRLGYDFNNVQVHNDSMAHQSSAQINALAYTHGKHVVFGTGQYQPHSNSGKQLLAHELVHTVQQGPYLQRSPKEKPPAKEPGKTISAPAAVKQKGLSRTLYVVQNDVWNNLPAAVKLSAETELNRLFAFVGMTKGEKPFTVKILLPGQLPAEFDFSESIVSVISDDVSVYLSNAFDLQQKTIDTWLAGHKIKTMPAKDDHKPGKPELIGRGGHSKRIIKQGKAIYAIPKMAGVVDIREVISHFFENIPALLEDQLLKLPGKGLNPSKWPKTVTSKGGTTKWNPQEMLGVALGRGIAHEARHEYIGPHSDNGLGQESAFLIGEKNSENFSEKDQKDMMAKIRELEKEQGTATVVPLYPMDQRSGTGSFPF